MAKEIIKKGSVRIPPHDTDAEKSVLGSLMLDKNAIHVIVDILNPEDFYNEKHSIIYGAMLELYSNKDPIDILTTSTKLKEKKILKDIGGSSYLTEIINSVPSSSNVKHYAEIVHKKSVLRDLITSSDHISQLGYQEDEDIDSLLDNAEQKIFSIARYSIKQKFQTPKGAVGEARERIARLHESKDELRGVSSGFPDLDNLLSGFQKSDLIILAARPSMGKTALALDIARHVAKNNKKVGIFSLEMSAQQVVDRLISAKANVDSWKLRTGRGLKDDELSRINDALEELSNEPIFIDDEASKNIMQMRAMARRLQAEHGLDLLIVDYLQLMTPRQKTDNIVQQMTEVSRSLKGLAKELNVPVLALSQLSRAVEARQDKRPKLHDLRDSGSIEQDADVVMFIYREDKYKDKEEDVVTSHSEAEILIEKHRNGPTGRVRLHFHPTKVTFRSVSKDDFGDL